MIKFLRNIRRNMITNNKVTKYFLYAIGEIILVVIGILIALQINNWNENKKNRELESEILAQIRDNLEQDQARLQEIRNSYIIAVRSSENLIDESKRAQYPDSIIYWLGHVIKFERFQPITNSYEALKSAGLQLVNDNELRKKLGLYYDDQINHTIQALGDVELAFNNEWLPLLENHVKDFKFSVYVKVEDMPSFLNETNAIRLFILNRDNIGAAINHVNDALKKIEEINSLMPENLR